MKFTNAIVLLGSLIVPAVINAKTCGEAAKDGKPADGKTRVRRIKIYFVKNGPSFLEVITIRS
jgi:hypothetical protein